MSYVCRTAGAMPRKYRCSHVYPPCISTNEIPAAAVVEVPAAASPLLLPWTNAVAARCPRHGDLLGSPPHYKSPHRQPFRFFGWRHVEKQKDKN